MSRDEALAMLRRWLLADHQATRNPAYLPALRCVEEKAWTTVRVGSVFYVAFACACPEIPLFTQSPA